MKYNYKEKNNGMKQKPKTEKNQSIVNMQRNTWIEMK